MEIHTSIGDWDFGGSNDKTFKQIPRARMDLRGAVNHWSLSPYLAWFGLAGLVWPALVGLNWHCLAIIWPGLAYMGWCHPRGMI